MIIKSVDLLTRSMELSEPYEVAYNTFTTAQNIFINIKTNEHSGWGCIAPDPDVTGESIPEIFSTASGLLPISARIRGEDYSQKSLLIMKKLKKVRPDSSACGPGVDMVALWDLLGKKQGCLSGK